MNEQLAFQDLLNTRLTELRVKNPAYSMRAFAKKSGLTSSALSEILRGKRRVSRELAGRVAHRLCLAPDQKAKLLGLFPEKLAYDSAAREKAIEYTQLSMDHFHVISDWYHFAILSLIETGGYRHDPEWVARRLGIKVAEGRAALDRLERLEMITVDKRGRATRHDVHYATSDDVASASLRKLHAQNLELARRSLEEDEVQERDFTAVTLAIDPKDLPEAKKMLREFTDRFTQRLERGAKKEVYKLCLQFIPLSKNGELK
jgi:uncharacterized protein (TIGR02147 family)